jgi:branched-subunit amino acid transport protein
MSGVWLAVIVVGVATIVIKGVGPVLLGGRELPPRIAGIVELAAPALLAALVVTQAVGGDRKLVFDARLAGVAAGAVAVRFHAPLVAVMVVAAVATALVRVAS